MPLRRGLAVLAVLAAGAGCGGSDERPTGPRAVQGSLDLQRSRSGPPDAGTRGGHGADRYLARAESDTLSITGMVRPASARITIADTGGTRTARADVGADGAFTAVLPDLPRGERVTFRLTATAQDAASWRTEVLVRRQE